MGEGERRNGWAFTRREASERGQGRRVDGAAHAGRMARPGGGVQGGRKRRREKRGRPKWGPPSGEREGRENGGGAAGWAKWAEMVDRARVWFPLFFFS